MSSATPVGYGAPAYTIRVTRLDYAGRTQRVEFVEYGVLRELMDDIEANVEVQAWLAESDPQPEAPSPFCSTPEKCAPFGYCTREIACNE
jgi:hypothetical protein